MSRAVGCWPGENVGGHGDAANSTDEEDMMGEEERRQTEHVCFGPKELSAHVRMMVGLAVMYVGSFLASEDSEQLICVVDNKIVRVGNLFLGVVWCCMRF